MHRLAVLVLLLCIPVAFHAGMSHGASGQKSKVTTLLQRALAEDFTPGREVLVDLVEIPPHAALDRHWHPGEEFHYYLEGEPVVQIGDAEPARPALGTVGHVPFRALHRAGAGAAGAKVLVFRVHTRGEPWRYLESAAPEGHDATRR